jgi:hypothetical protein
MRGRVSKKVQTCYQRASACRRNAEYTHDPKSREAFLTIETSWLRLAESFEFAERMDAFISASQALIGPLMVRCPRTSRALNTGIETSYAALAGSWNRVVQVRCEHCGGRHGIPVRDGYIQRRNADMS